MCTFCIGVKGDGIGVLSQDHHIQMAAVLWSRYSISGMRCQVFLIMHVTVPAELKKDSTEKTERAKLLDTQICLKQEEIRQITQSTNLRRSNLDRWAEYEYVYKSPAWCWSVLIKGGQNYDKILGFYLCNHVPPSALSVARSCGCTAHCQQCSLCAIKRKTLTFGDGQTNFLYKKLQNCCYIIDISRNT